MTDLSTAAVALVPGVDVVIGTRTLTLPPLPLVKVPTVQSLFAGSADPLADPVYVQAFVDALYWSLRRNYPDIDPAFVAENVDVANFPVLLDGYMQANGLDGAKAGSAEKKSRSTGTKSLST